MATQVPSDLLWRLTRKSSSFIVKRKIDTFNADPLSVTNLLNAKDSGLANTDSVSLGLRRKKAKKATSRVFELKRHYNQHHKGKKMNGVVNSNFPLTKEVNKAAAVIDKLRVSDARKNQLKHRLMKLHKGNNAFQKQRKNTYKRN